MSLIRLLDLLTRAVFPIISHFQTIRWKNNFQKTNFFCDGFNKIMTKSIVYSFKNWYIRHSNNR